MSTRGWRRLVYGGAGWHTRVELGDADTQGIFQSRRSSLVQNSWCNQLLFCLWCDFDASKKKQKKGIKGQRRGVWTPCGRQVENVKNDKRIGDKIVPEIGQKIENEEIWPK